MLYFFALFWVVLSFVKSFVELECSLGVIYFLVNMFLYIRSVLGGTFYFLKLFTLRMTAVLKQSESDCIFL